MPLGSRSRPIGRVSASSPRSAFASSPAVNRFRMVCSSSSDMVPFKPRSRRPLALPGRRRRRDQQSGGRAGRRCPRADTSPSSCGRAASRRSKDQTNLTEANPPDQLLVAAAHCGGTRPTLKIRVRSNAVSMTGSYPNATASTFIAFMKLFASAFNCPGVCRPSDKA